MFYYIIYHCVKDNLMALSSAIIPKCLGAPHLSSLSSPPPPLMILQEKWHKTTHSLFIVCRKSACCDLDIAH